MSSRPISHRMQRSNSKYGNKKVVIDGFTFDSRKEGNRYMELKFMLAAGKITDLEVHKPFTLQPGFKSAKDGKSIRPIKYICDFSYYDLEKGELVVEDVKSPPTAKKEPYVTKKKMMAYQYGIYIEEVY